MGLMIPYSTTLGEMIKDLEALAKIHGRDTELTLPNPSGYYPDFDGQNSKLTAELSRQPGPKRIVIVEKDIE